MRQKRPKGFYQCASCDRKGKTKDDMEICYENRHDVLYYPEDSDDSIIPLENLIQIENPDLTGKLVKVNAIVSSNTISYNVPSKITVKCKTTSDDHTCAGSGTFEIKLVDLVGFTEINEISRERRSKTIAVHQGNFSKSCDFTIQEEKQLTVKKIRVRPVVHVLERKNKILSDSEGNEYKSYDIYLVQDSIRSHEAGKEIEIVGHVIPDPKSQKITLVAKSAEKIEDQNIDFQKIKNLQDFFSTLSITDICNWIVAEFEKYSKIVKRGNITIAGFLTFFSPLSFEFEDKKINGWARTIIIGDSTTGKSETVTQLIHLLQDGQMIIGETASIAGLGATATQSANSQWFVEYGPLVLQDRKLLAVDGANKLNREQWSTLAEAERTGVLKITKAAKGEAHARTRQIKIMNPVGDDFRTTRPMSSFFYSAHSIQNSLQIQNIARQDMAIFVKDDVGSEFRNIKNGHVHDEKLGYFAELLKFCWKQNYSVIMEDNVYDEILKQANYLEAKFKCEDIPLITNDQKYKLAKLGMSLAFLSCSFSDDLTKLHLKKEHIQFVSSFIDSEYHNAGLDIIAQNRMNKEVDEDDLYYIMHSIKRALESKEPQIDDDFCKQILLWIAQQVKFTKDQLAAKFGLKDHSELRPLTGALKNLGIIEDRKGFVPTNRAIETGKYLATVATVAMGKKGYPTQTLSQTQEGVSPFEGGKYGKYGKIDDFADSDEPEQVQKGRLCRCKTCGGGGEFYENIVGSAGMTIKSYHENLGHEIEYLDGGSKDVVF